MATLIPNPLPTK